MNKMALDFALDLQEQSNGSDFIESLKTTISNNIKNINYDKSTDDTISFVDNSACKFEGHNIVLIENL